MSSLQKEFPVISSDIESSLGVPPQDHPSQDHPLIDQLIQECQAMAKYILANGLSVECALVARLALATDQKKAVSETQVEELVNIHLALSKVVSPSTPKAILMLESEDNERSWTYILGPVPLIRRLTVIAIFFLLTLLGVSMSGSVNLTELNAGLLASEGRVLVLNQVFILSCAGLGASFFALFQANSYIAKATYDPRFDSDYWTRIILGMIAGIIIVELLPSTIFNQGSMAEFGKPALAMLSGFSVTVVYRILQRLVETMETVVRGRDRDSKDRGVDPGYDPNSREKRG
ncbi:hypothetical protein BTA51_29420 [Hahella sp. CCB-MM4]|uniref:hypothetical protein n=1 Tax=Hahella sp. (strain CCB-MM4) TaxID=1926491 RepID=UPI000B9C437E|nr:hypothetical protein [Hahella sp. CCB-MM4]OZG69746.1 hypothetical protein BTA51_29420 [Hahella sp. CCB-MM4]